jgi:uncharacterized sporulation protein YeaH/YhbH (DUF444 family)
MALMAETLLDRRIDGIAALPGESWPICVLFCAQTKPYAARMQTMRETWTDERLDDLNGRVSDGFERVEGQVRDLRGEMNARFEKVDERFDKVEAKFDKVDQRFAKVDVKFERIDDQLGSIQRAVVLLAVTLTGSMIAGFAAMIALFATQF